MKICCKCKIEQLYENYCKAKNRKDGYNPVCKSCSKKWREENKEILSQKKKEYYRNNREAHRSYHKQKYHTNKEKYTKQIREYYETNRDQYLLNKSRDRARECGIEHTISLEDIIIPEFCPVLDIKLTSTLGKGQLETNASIDRIDSSKGYVPGNVQVISRKANTMKNNATIEELKKFGEWCAKL